MPLLWELLVIGGLILVNGLLVAAETAILAARRSRLEEQAAAGKWSARLALDLARDPRRLFFVTRVAATGLGLLAATLSGVWLSVRLADMFSGSQVQFVAAHPVAMSLAATVLGVAFLWLLLGELVPKRLALGSADRLATLAAYPVHWLALLIRPAIGLLDLAAAVILVVFRGPRAPEPAVHPDDIERLLIAGPGDDAPAPAEAAVARKALRLAERTVREIMRPRIEIDALDVDTPVDEVIGAAAMAGFSRLPVHEGDLDHIIGFIYMKDLLRQQHMGWPIELRKLVRPALLVPTTMHIDTLLETFRQKRTQMAIVLDEFGGTQGLVTMEDVLEELVGEIHDELRQDRPQDILRRDETSWLVGGGVNIGDLLEQLGLDALCGSVPRDYTTVGGLVIWLLGRIPQTGDRCTWNHVQLEVVAMDGPRIARILVCTRDVPR